LPVPLLLLASLPALWPGWAAAGPKATLASLEQSVRAAMAQAQRLREDLERTPVVNPGAEMAGIADGGLRFSLVALRHSVRAVDRRVETLRLETRRLETRPLEAPGPGSGRPGSGVPGSGGPGSGGPGSGGPGSGEPGSGRPAGESLERAELMLAMRTQLGRVVWAIGEIPADVEAGPASNGARQTALVELEQALAELGRAATAMAALDQAERN